MPRNETLESYLKAESSASIAATISALADVSAKLSNRISQGPLAGALSLSFGSNSDGDAQKALDIIADDAFADALKSAPVKWYASEERETVEAFADDGTLAVAIDPLDGSSNIDCNVAIGTIFSIFEAKDDADASFLRPGHEQVAAGYVIYGPQTALLLTLGNGTAMFVYDRAADTFMLATTAFAIPPSATEFAINASNYRHWSKPIRAYIDDCLAGADGPRGKNFNMRWVASLVAETHRILTRGGIFLYPGDTREGYARGRLRVVYECAPIAFLVEQAGGKATDACDRILDHTPATLHARTPFVFGSADKVDRIAAYHDLPTAEVSPLFGKRGLFSG